MTRVVRRGSLDVIMVEPLSLDQSVLFEPNITLVW